MFIKLGPCPFCREVSSSIDSFFELIFVFLQSHIIQFYLTALIPIPTMYCCNQLSGLSPVTRQHGLSNRGSLLSRQHLFPSMGYCSGNTCESNSLTGEHMCTCYDGLRYLEMGQYLLEECDCADCPMLDMISYGGLIASGFGR